MEEGGENEGSEEGEWGRKGRGEFNYVLTQANLYAFIGYPVLYLLFTCKATKTLWVGSIRILV